jgi:Ca2+/H+ antiporter
MGWLKENSYLAEWLAIPVAVAISLVTVKGKTLAQVNWPEVLVNLAFIVSLSVVLTEGHSGYVRGSATTICMFTLVRIMWYGPRR